MHRYEAQGQFIWMYDNDDDKTGQLLCYVFQAAQAPVLADMLNTALILAAAVVQDCQPQQPAAQGLANEKLLDTIAKAVFDPHGNSMRQVDPVVAQRLAPQHLFTWDGEPGD